MKQTRNREHPGGVPPMGFEGGHAVQAEQPTFIYRADDLSAEADHVDVADERPEETKELSDFDYRLLARYLVIWMHQDGKAGPQGVKIRAYVLAQFLTPEIYSHANNTALAEQAGLSKQSLNKVMQEFRDHFHMVLTNMKSEDARKAYRNKSQSTKIKHAQTRQFNQLYRSGLVLQEGAGI